MPASIAPSDARSAPEAVLFDAYGTLFDVYSVALRAEQMFPGQGQALARLWRDRQIDYSRLLTMSGRYQPFWDLTRAALQYAAAALGLALAPAGEDALMNEYRHLSAFPENQGVLQDLRARGVRCGLLSNGDPDMLAVALRSAGLDALLDPVLSVHAIQRFKTDPAAYALGPRALGLPAARILFVSSNAWDAIGATWAGYQTLWINRADAPPERLSPQPHHTGRSLRAVLDLFPAAA